MVRVTNVILTGSAHGVVGGIGGMSLPDKSGELSVRRFCGMIPVPADDGDGGVMGRGLRPRSSGGRVTGVGATVFVHSLEGMIGSSPRDLKKLDMTPRGRDLGIAGGRCTGWTDGGL